MASRCASPKCWHTATVLLRPHEQSGELFGLIHCKGQQGVKPRAEVVADILMAIRERRA